mgnify:CR=1 FL=1
MVIGFIAAAAGVMVSLMVSSCPGMHVYNILGLVSLLAFNGSFPETLSVAVMPFIIGLIAGYVILSSVGLILLSVPDESFLLTVMPSQRFVIYGRGEESVFWMGLGSAIGAIIIFVLFGCFGRIVFSPMKAVLTPHFHWMLWAVIIYMFISEWSGDAEIEQGGVISLLKSFRKTGVGILVFLLSGWFGFVMFYKSPLSVDTAFQNMAPVFSGLFAFPSLLLNIISKVQIPQQRKVLFIKKDYVSLIKGSIAGLGGGVFSAFMPVVTGGIGGLLAGSVFDVREKNAFIVSQGVVRMIYYAGGFMFFFVPGINMSRGGAAWIYKLWGIPKQPTDLWMAVSYLALASSFAVILLFPLSRSMMRTIQTSGIKKFSMLGIVIICILIVILTGIKGLAVTFAATCVGLVPLICGGRRINLLGFLLLPMACKMSGIADNIVLFLKLM